MNPMDPVTAVSATRPFDLVTMGRIGVDLYPLQSHRVLAEVDSFSRSLGGSPTNVAVAAARLGLRSAVVTKVGNDAFGEFARSALERFGVATRWVGTNPHLRTPITFCELHPPDSFPLLFYREPQAPDATFRFGEIEDDAIVAPAVLWTTSGALAVEPSRSATLDALARRRELNPRGVTVHDLDHRPGFWEPGEDPGELAREALSFATVAVGNFDEVEMAVGTRDPRRAAEKLLALGVETAIVKRGADGVYARTSDAEIDLPAVRLEVVNGLGAGDAFGGALAYGIVSGLELDAALRMANASGSIVASRLACADAMPELEELLPFAGEVTA